MGRKIQRPGISGFFDFLKKKPEQKSFFKGLIPTGKPQLPAHPATREKRSPFDILKPTPPSSNKSLIKAPAFFGILKPRPQPPAPPKAAPQEALWKNMFKPATEPEEQQYIHPEAPVKEKAPESPAPKKPFAMFPMATDEPQGELRDLFKGILKSEPKTAQRYVFITPTAPPESTPRGPYGLVAPSTRPVVEWTFPSVGQLAEHFHQKMNLTAMWDVIRDIRSSPEFLQDQFKNYQKGLPIIVRVDPVVYQEVYTDFANFYGIPWGVMDMYLSVPDADLRLAEETLWNNVISPLNAMVPDAFELLKPEDLPGFFNVGFTEPKGEYWLFYVEPMQEQEAKGGS